MDVHPFNEFNLDPALAESVAGVEPNLLIEGILRLNDPREIPLGFGVVCRFDRIFTGRFRAADAWTIRRNSNVASLKAARPIGTPELERSLDAGSELPQRAVPPYTGRGSVVAALDFGLDFAHPNFRNADGSSRVLAFWNQGAGYDISHPNSYGYGRVFSRAEINKALEAEDPYSALGYHPSISDTGSGSHGTHTLDIATGNGRVGAASAASAADILFVHLSTPRLDAAGNLGDSVRLLEGLDFVSRTAGDRPCVVNLSIGRTAGSKDGTSLVEQGMHECLRMGKDRAIVQSAGNYRSANLTVEGWVQEGESRELLWVIQPNDPTPNELDIWYSGKDRLMIEIRPPHSTESILITLGRMEEILYEGNVIGRVYHRKNDPNNGDNHCEIFLRTAAPAGTWIVRLVGEYVISGRFHAWIERDIGRAGAQSRFAPEIASERYTLGTIATSPLVITVGAYDAYDHAGLPAPFSSQGPTRDERMYKPELLAPGVSVVAARSIPRGETHQEGLTVARSGTSMAAPHVTGLVAAMFEAAGRSLSIHEIRDCLRLSAAPLDAEEHGAYWGRVNAVEAIRLTRGEPVAEVVADSAPEDDCPCRSVPPVLANEASVDVGADEGEPIMAGMPAALVVQAELALSRSGGARRESEIIFLRELLGALGWQPSGALPSPAQLFRLAAGDDGGVGGLVRMIGGPLQRTSETLRPGDWMIRVAPGTGDVGHVSVLVSNDLMSRSRIRNEGIPAESTLPGYYGTVIEGGAYPHDRSTPFARRFLDSGGRVPPHSVILRPAPGASENAGEYDTGEHVLAGNGLYGEMLRAGKGQAVSLSYGQVIAMGDLYDTVDDLMNADPAELNRLKTLIVRSTRYYEGKRSDPALDVKNKEWDDATQGRYLKLAEGNYEHFSPHAVAMGSGVKTVHGDNRSQWEIYHRRAIEDAQDQFLKQSGKTSVFFERALLINAFGDHFLTDAFASGHLINKEAMIVRFKSAFFAGSSLSAGGEKFFERVADKAWVGKLAAEFSKLETVDYPTVHVPWYIAVLPGGLPLAGRDVPVPIHPNINSASRFASVLKEAAKQQPERVGNLIVKALHDYLNEHGIEVTNNVGDGTWVLPGDGTLMVGTGGLTPADLAKNLAIMRRAVQQSIDDINSPTIQVSNLNFQPLFEGVWRHVPRLTTTSQRQMTGLIADYTDPNSSRLVQAAADIVTEQLDSFIKLLIDEHKLKPE